MSAHLTSLLGDERVARHAAAGDRRAFEEIYRRYRQPLYRFCLAMVGNTSDAQDALQNTMVKVLRALPGEDRQIALKPWLYRIARNEAVETLRRRPDQVEPERSRSPPRWRSSRRPPTGSDCAGCSPTSASCRSDSGGRW